MTTLDRAAIERVLGPVDNELLAAIVASECGEDELREAHAWMTSDEALVNDHRPFPSGRVADLVELLREHDSMVEEE